MRTTELLLLVRDMKSTRDSVVPAYADAILMECFRRPPIMDVDWSRVNRAIIDRWSVSALTYIKKHAFASAERQARSISAR